ncbi:MAG: hypothetical protein J3K34DRAFT_423735 [Monoraphidium minutum]|nr:MAG: hypothetical protein J3K34DRAFT_423735 [Monoraphidium minutum]
MRAVAPRAAAAGCSQTLLVVGPHPRPAATAGASPGRRAESLALGAGALLCRVAMHRMNSLLQVETEPGPPEVRRRPIRGATRPRRAAPGRSQRRRQAAGRLRAPPDYLTPRSATPALAHGRTRATQRRPGCPHPSNRTRSARYEAAWFVPLCLYINPGAFCSFQTSFASSLPPLPPLAFSSSA